MHSEKIVRAVVGMRLPISPIQNTFTFLGRISVEDRIQASSQSDFEPWVTVWISASGPEDIESAVERARNTAESTMRHKGVTMVNWNNMA